jgi:hypothetical protein
LTDEELRTVLKTCSLRLKHVLMTMRFATPADPYVARNCRVRIAKQLEDKKLVETKLHGRLDWLVVRPNEDGERAIELLVEALKVRPSKQAISERLGR